MAETFADRVSRRRLLSAGVLASGGLSLPQLLRCRQARAEDAPAPRSAILIFLAGGPSHFETFDPKPTAPAEIRGPYAPIATNVPGIQISENLPKLAHVADKYSLIRSVAHDNPGHGGGQRYVQTGYKSASLENELPHDYPVVGSVVSRVRGAMHGGLPTFIRCPDSNDGGAAFLGNAYDPFPVYSTGKPVGLEVHSHIKLERMANRRALRQSFDVLPRHANPKRVMDAMDDLEQQAYEMLTSTSAHDAFDLEKETAEMQLRYGKHEAGRCCLLARRFIQAGAGLVSVRIGSWDHHGNAGGTVVSGTMENAPPFDQAVAALITDLHERGMSNDVLIWVWGEFGRTPRINNTFGRDHWPQAMSVLMSGGGIRPGMVVGATNKNGEFPVDNSHSPADVLATVYRQLGIDAERQFVNTAGRPISVLGHGTAISELIG